MKMIKFLLWLGFLATIVTLAVLADRFYGKGAGGFVFLAYFGILSFFVGVPLLILLMLPPLKWVLGPAQSNLATANRISIWLTLAEIFSFQNVSEEEVFGIAQHLRSLGADERTVKIALETEVGPVCQGRMMRAGDDYFDGIDKWDREWLTRQVIAGTKAYKFLRAIPLIGYYWSRLVTMTRRQNINLLLGELRVEPNPE